MQLVFYLTTFSTPCMCYLLYLMFRSDKKCDRCDGKFGNFMGTKHTPASVACVPRIGTDDPTNIYLHVHVCGACMWQE